jgi:hypothetical protein
MACFFGMFRSFFIEIGNPWMAVPAMTSFTSANASEICRRQFDRSR